MGLTFSGNEVVYDSVSSGFESILTRSLSSGDNARSALPFGNNARSTLRSVSFSGRDSETCRHGKSRKEGPAVLSGRDMYSLAFPVESTKSDEPKTSSSGSHARKRSIDFLDDDTPEHEAAVKLQKVYKSFRTRRQLADCAVLVEQRWWKLLDFALLKRNSVSFFDIDKHESAVSRWSRAKSRAAKVGKGLSKDEKAKKLALQHWLEAIDPRHRYGHNLQFYYECWLQCESMEPFFYWLDVGEGKEVNLEHQCARWKLQQQCIKYLGPKERDAYEVIIEDGKFTYKQSRQVLDTSGGPKESKWIFVLSTSKKLYVGQKKKGTFQHSSFLAGGATSSAGRLVVEDGVLKAVWPHSGHYQPTEENFQEFMSFLEENSVDLTDVKKSPEEDDEHGSSRLRNNFSDRNIVINSEIREEETCDDAAAETSSSDELPEKLADKERDSLPVPGREESEEGNDKQVLEKSFVSDGEEKQQVLDHKSSGSDDDEQQHYIFRKKNLFLWDRGEEEAASVPSELILRRINSKKGIKSFQLGKQLSCKWTTGAGPRIGFVRDYPSELQFRSLEQVSLSPRSSPNASRFASSPRISQSGSPAAKEEEEEAAAEDNSQNIESDR